MNLHRIIIRIFLLFLITTSFSCGGGGGGGPTTPPLKPLPAEYSAIRQLEADAETKTFDLLTGGMEIKEALIEVVNWAKTQSVVADAGLYEGEDEAWVKFFSGQYTTISIIDNAEKSGQYIKGSFIKEIDPYLRDTANGTTPDFLIADNPGFAYIGLHDIVCDAVYPSPSLVNLDYGYTGGKRFETHLPKVEDFAGLNKYSFIYISTHGNDQLLRTGETVLPEEPVELLATQEWLQSRVYHDVIFFKGPSSVEKCGIYYRLTTKFFTNEYKQNNFKDGSIIIINACESYPNFTNAFLSVGASTVVGWECKAPNIEPPYIESILKKVCPQDPKEKPISLVEAVQEWNSDTNLWDKYGEGDNPGNPDGKQDLWLVTQVGKPHANPIPIIDEVTTEGAGNNTRIIVKGNYGTLKEGQIGFLVNEATDWNQATYVQILSESWTSTEASMPIPGNLSYGKYQVRIRSNGILSNVKEFTFTPPNPIEMTVGSYHLTFSNAYAGWVVEPDDFAIFFVEQPGIAYPLASIQFMGNASTLTTGVTLYPYGVDGYINQDILHTSFESDDANPCQVVFGTLELKPLGRVSGTLTGSVWADFDADDEEELYPISCTFDNILVFTQQSYQP